PSPNIASTARATIDHTLLGGLRESDLTGIAGGEASASVTGTGTGRAATGTAGRPTGTGGAAYGAATSTAGFLFRCRCSMMNSIGPIATRSPIVSTSRAPGVIVRPFTRVG